MTLHSLQFYVYEKKQVSFVAFDTRRAFAVYKMLFLSSRDDKNCVEAERGD